MTSPLKVLIVAPEVVPFAKTGGLADVAGALPAALRGLGVDARVVLPCYAQVAAAGFRPRLHPARAVVPLGDGVYEARVRSLRHAEVPVWFIDAPAFFARPALYGDAGGDYPDNPERFGFFARALLRLLPQLDFRPDLIHLHDWQTGLIPVLLRTELARHPFYRDMASLLTLHNLGYQGNFPPAVLATLGLDPRLFHPGALEYFGSVSFLKGGLLFADRINTVSPTYAREILTPAHGHGFEGILAARREHLSGLLNGLDCSAWNPETDPALPAHYSLRRPAGKARCKAALQRELGLAVAPELPLVAMVTRLDRQKGTDLVRAAWPALMAHPLQFVLLGSGSREEMDAWRALQPDRKRAAILLQFDEALSHRIYAASDLFLMPSRYEPCGLSQLIALRYGSLPVVRRTGGLADTVTDADQAPASGNGFAFDPATPEALLAALDRALTAWHDPARRALLRRRGMSADLSWQHAAREYLNLYRQTLEGQRDPRHP